MPTILFAWWCFWLIFHLGASVSWWPWNLCLTVKYPHNMPIGRWSHVSCCRFCALDFCFIYRLWLLCLWSVCFRGFSRADLYCCKYLSQNLWMRVVEIISNPFVDISILLPQKAGKNHCKESYRDFDKVPRHAYFTPEADDFSPQRFWSCSSVISRSNFVPGRFIVFLASL